MLEIGVQHGGSLQMWSDYFGPSAKIYGVDINPKCAQCDLGENIEIIIGSQEDRNFLNNLKNVIPKIDILIDDGGHTMKQQITTYEELFDHIKEDGVYLCEDLHTSYWPNYGGGYKKEGTFIEYSKNFIDYINMANPFHKSGPQANDPNLVCNEFTKSVGSIHYYDSTIVIEKKKSSPPRSIRTGIHSCIKTKKTNFI